MPQCSPLPDIDPLPEISITPFTPGTSWMRFWMSSSTRFVRSSVAPCGSSTSIMIMPLSSSGRSVSFTQSLRNQQPPAAAAKRMAEITTWRTSSRTTARYPFRAPSITKLTGAKRRGGRALGGRNRREQSTGESVSATKVERQSATHIVNANWMYIFPTMPP